LRGGVKCEEKREWEIFREDRTIVREVNEKVRRSWLKPLQVIHRCRQGEETVGGGKDLRPAGIVSTWETRTGSKRGNANITKEKSSSVPLEQGEKGRVVQKTKQKHKVQTSCA